MKLLVFAEQREGQLKSYALEAISEGRRLADATGGTLLVALIGSGISDLADQVSAYGADEVVVADDAGLKSYAPGA
ncbi:MAG: electron transfer flavoprotein subunit alpha, partial [Candidatus Marinimicrobia bacterium]|nr:electron transfer flavoprotein subunit alpha [Candidatus Neomarinimicrobiota bacterium]